MGIPAYFSFIVKKHLNVIKKLRQNSFLVNNLYLDCNSIIYDAVHSIDFTKLDDTDVNTIIRDVIKKIDNYISLIKPDTNIFIAFDGVAPVAKMEQQRQRRYKSVYQNSIIKSIYGTSKPDPWNTNCLTPGTVFMENLNKQIKNYYKNPEKYNLKNIIISCSDKPGEGEHKIFQFIRDHQEFHSDKTTVIYGLDADLIMLCINHLPICNKIYLFRETPHFIKSLQSELEPNETYLLDIPELAMAITFNMNNSNVELSLQQLYKRIYDYIFLCFFLGNDFMPHFPSVNIRTGGVDKMLNAYKATIGSTNEYLTDGKTIIWKNVRKLVHFLSEQEEENIKNEFKLRDKMEKRFLPIDTPNNIYKKFDSLPTHDRSVEKSINPFKPNWKQRYYKTLFHIEIDDERLKQICLNYLEGLEWTMKYYTSGCPDWRWKYKYSYPPLLCDLIHYIPYFETEFIENKPPSPVSELVQLCYVMPRENLHLLPNKLYNALVMNKPEWYDTTQTDFTWAFCRYFWESHANLPHLEINELEDFVKSNK